MDYRKKKSLIWKGESFLFVVVLLVFGAIFAAIHTGGLIQKQDSVQLLNKVLHKRRKKTGDHPACGNSGKNR